MPLRTPADVNVTAAEDSAGHSADFLSKLLAQGEKLRDEMASVRASMASLEEERQKLLRDNEEATAQVEAQATC